MKNLLCLCLLLPMLLSVQAVRAAATDPAAVPFAARTVTLGTETYGYQVFIPTHRDARKKCPVILFLHGSGEQGDDNMAQTKNGIRLLIAQDLEHFPAVVVCPQCRRGASWNDPTMQAMALTALDQSVREFDGDPDRVSLTGLSLGGYGTWDLAQKYPQRWAAIAPCCGGIVFARRPRPGTDAAPETPPAIDPYALTARRVARIPVWVFHGGADHTVPVSESRQMVALLFMLHADLHYTEYPGVGHNSWDYAYKEPGLLPWFLSHKRHL